MALSLDELKYIASHMRKPLDPMSLSRTQHPADDAYALIHREIYRLEVGPFTLAEAVASGRPFRRKGWVPGLYADDIYDSECGHCESEGPMRFSFVAVDIENAFVEADDITAIDYELQPEGGEG